MHDLVRNGQAGKVYFFTLFELLICMALLSLLGGILAFKTKPMLAHYQFERSVKKLAEEITLTRHFSIICRADMELHIKKKGSQWILIRKKEEPVRLFLHFDREIRIDHLPLLLFNGKKVDQIILFFTGTGWVTPEGKLELYSKKSQQEGEAYTIEVNQRPFYEATKI